MAGFKFTLAASALLVAAASAHEGHEHSSSSGSSNSSISLCSTDVSESFIATIDNSTYFDTCAEGTTFNISSVFGVLNFTDSEFMTFCNSSTCLEPLHELMGSVDCLITYEGSARDLAEEITELHEKCHEVLDAAEGSTTHMDMSMSGMDMGGSTASGSSAASSVVMAAGSIVSAAVVAVFLA
ncbi:unnamed protein product [Phytophthora fragariaefolia]|uniref:Elicitin n=1 Tax=Phytophthora fragariaefolia TaxID=1490495 RepID=A0A9W6Y5U2_9STRA|nr:unnamed protein product [Phytophthora fragariaefolia]